LGVYLLTGNDFRGFIVVVGVGVVDVVVGGREFFSGQAKGRAKGGSTTDRRESYERRGTMDTIRAELVLLVLLVLLLLKVLLLLVVLLLLLLLVLGLGGITLG
jgi:hypothetical protein